MIINDIIDFANKLNDYGKENKIEPVQIYATDILKAIQSFDMDLVSRNIDKFHYLINKQ